MSAKPDAHMPFYGDDFFAAVEMMGEASGFKYLRCVWFYWSHLHCEGIPNDDEQMRNLCRCELGSWLRTKGLIFDNDKFFVLEGDKWHQKRARSEWTLALSKLTDRYKQTEAATAARLAKKVVTSNVTRNVTFTKPEPEPEPVSTAEREYPEVVARMSLAEVKATANMIGLAEWKAVDWWQEMEGCGWLDHNRRPIYNARAILARVKTKWESDGRPSSPPKSRHAAEVEKKKSPLHGCAV